MNSPNECVDATTSRSAWTHASIVNPIRPTSHKVDDTRLGVNRTCDQSFREESHAIDATAAGQGIAICSDVVVGHELTTGSLVKAHEFSMPGYRYHLVYVTPHPRAATIQDSPFGCVQ